MKRTGRGDWRCAISFLFFADQALSAQGTGEVFTTSAKDASGFCPVYQADLDAVECSQQICVNPRSVWDGEANSLW